MTHCVIDLSIFSISEMTDVWNFLLELRFQYMTEFDESLFTSGSQAVLAALNSGKPSIDVPLKQLCSLGIGGELAQLARAVRSKLVYPVRDCKRFLPIGCYDLRLSASPNIIVSASFSEFLQEQQSLLAAFRRLVCAWLAQYFNLGFLPLIESDRDKPESQHATQSDKIAPVQSVRRLPGSGKLYSEVDSVGMTLSIYPLNQERKVECFFELDDNRLFGIAQGDQIAVPHLSFDLVAEPLHEILDRRIELGFASDSQVEAPFRTFLSVLSSTYTARIYYSIWPAYEYVSF
jgi:hypothetical protein